MLRRKIRKVGSSLVITIPSHIANAFDYQEGMELSVTAKEEHIIYAKNDMNNQACKKEKKP